MFRTTVALRMQNNDVGQYSAFHAGQARSRHHSTPSSLELSASTRKINVKARERFGFCHLGLHTERVEDAPLLQTECHTGA
jgi:hypothetical protein